MKRSEVLALTVMGVTVAGFQMFRETGSDGPEPTVDGAVYQSLQECQDAGAYSDAQCEKAFNGAKVKHATNSPRYGSRESCIEVHGEEACERTQSSGGGSFWGPALAGYFVGQSLNGGYRNAPMYRDRNASGSGVGGFRTTAGRSVSLRNGKATIPDWATRFSRSRTSAVSRGGFGGRSSGWGRSSWGG